MPVQPKVIPGHKLGKKQAKIYKKYTRRTVKQSLKHMCKKINGY